MYRYPMTFIVAAVVYIFTFALPAPPSFAEGARLAVVAGNNHGGHERLPLRFAEEDARRMAGVLTGLGRADPEDVRLLQGSTPEDFLEAIEAAGRRAVARDDEASLIIVFYSGHADGESLLMGEERLGISELKAAVEDAGASIALIILDACYSGTAASAKGGQSAPSFLRIDQSPRARGHIVLTSASASELAQESDEIGSSFFTHYLVSGLMGDADRSADGKVTLNELYDYVYDRTVLRTVDTLPGVQHPAFSFEIEGEGSIVLTDLNNESTGIILDEQAAGTYLLFDEQRRSVVAELDKRAGERRLIPVSAGEYVLKKRQPGHLLVAELEVTGDQRILVSDSDMHEVAFENHVAKGWDLNLRSKKSDVEVLALAGWTTFTRSPAGGIWSFPTAGVGVFVRGFPHRRANTRVGVTAGGWRSSLPVEERRMDFVLFYSGAFCSMGLDLSYGPFAAELGGRTSIDYLGRRFSEDGYQGSDGTLGFSLGAAALASVDLGPVTLALELAGGMFAFPDADRWAIPYFSGGLHLGVGL